MTATNNWKRGLDGLATERHVMAAWVAVLLNPFWAINDYLILPGHWKHFLVIRIFISLITLWCILFRNKLNINHRILVFVPFLGICLQNAYMGSVMNVTTLQIHTFAYTAIFIGAGMLLIWPAVYSVAVVLITGVFNIILFNLLSPLGIREILLNGGLLTFTVAVLTIVLTHDRYESLKKEMKTKINLAESNNKILEQKDTIEKQVGELNKVNKRLSRFAYIISHDLKAPLRGVRHLADWIATDSPLNMTSETSENLNLLKKQVTKMEQMINGVLEYSKATSGGDKDTVDLNEIITEVTDELLLKDKMRLTISKDLPSVYAVRISMKQVIQNLLGNAVKHSDKEITDIEIGHEFKNGMVEIFIKDNGPGIPKSAQERVFELFQTLRPGTADNTGVGLPIVKNIIEEAGGSIWIESEPGKGSEFRFTCLPADKEPAISKAALSASI